MNDQTSSPSCPDCGAPLPPDSPQALCPACLMRQALASRTIVNDGDKPNAVPPPTPEEIADRFPQFEILECLGRGGMGVVYKARQKSLNRIVAIKILAPERENEIHFAERFAREAEILAKLNHPHIVTIHDFGETGGLFYLVMEFVDGVNLRDLLSDGKLEAKQALAIIPPICEALQFAHDKGIVHRDIKPENLLLDRDGRIKIADFGIASLVGATGEQSGTPPYMAPEQGAHTNIDHRADIYALGAVLYEMLTGDRPASPLALPSQKVQLDIRIDDIVLRALNKEPERRYRTANEFRTVVENVTPESAPPALRSTAVPPPQRPEPKKGLFRRFWWFLLIMIPLGPVLGVAGGLLIGSVSPKKFAATAVVQVMPDKNEPFSNSPHEDRLGDLLSPIYLDQISRQLNLPTRWDLPEAAINNELRKSLHLETIRGTDLVEIQVLSPRANDASSIANTLAELWAADPLASPIIMHQMAVPPNQPVSRLRKCMLIGGPLGLLLSPFIALALMAICHRLIPQRSTQSTSIDEDPDSKRALYSKLSLGLFLIGILGTLAMMTLSHRHDMALIFGAVALTLSLIFGLKSGRRAFVVILITIAILAIVSIVASALIFYLRSANIDQHVSEKAAKKHDIETIAKLKALEHQSKGLTFGPTRIHDLTAPTVSSANCFLDLDTGQPIDAPTDIYRLIKHRFNAAVSKPIDVDQQIGTWASDTGADLMISMMNPSAGLAIYGGSISFPNFSFEEAEPSDVMKQANLQAEARSESGDTPPPFISFSAPGPDSREAVVFRTREGGVGILKFIKTTTNPTGVKVSYKLIENPNNPPEEIANFTFGPVIERVVNDDRPGASGTLIDFDTGKVISPPTPELANWQWMRANGIDAIGCTDADVLGLVSAGGTVIVPTTEEAWLNPDVLQVRQTAIPLSATEQGGVAIPGGGESPSTFIFKTRGRALGLLQIIGLSEDTSATRIRYRLIVNKNAMTQKPLEDFERVALAHMKAVENMDVGAAQALWFIETELTEKKRSQRLQDYREMKQAYKAEPALMTTFSEWYRNGGYAVARLTPPKGGDGRSIYLILGHSPKGWRIVDINDIRSNESLPGIFDAFLIRQEQ